MARIEVNYADSGLGGQRMYWDKRYKEPIKVCRDGLNLNFLYILFTEKKREYWELGGIELWQAD